jgi:transcriptional regulator with XRE-family HTH domain
MPARFTTTPFVKALEELLSDRKMSRRALAREAGIEPAYLSRVVAGQKPISPDIVRRCSVALGLPTDYFPEARAAAICEAVREDGALRDRLYRQISRRP